MLVYPSWSFKFKAWQGSDLTAGFKSMLKCASEKDSSLSYTDRLSV